MTFKNLVKLSGVVVLALWSCLTVKAQLPPADPMELLDSWSFTNSIWLSDLGNAPLSFTNLNNPPGFAGNALEVDSTNISRLQYKIVEADGATNLTFTEGTLEVWVLPDWNSGTGPGDWGRLIDVGAYSTNDPSSWWSLYFNRAGTGVYFSSETNGVFTNYLKFAISWDTNTWHFLALSYNHLRTEFYIDGQLATHGPGAFYVPSAEVISNGFFVGSDVTGLEQSRALMAYLAAYSVARSGNEISNDYAAGLQITNGGGWGGGGETNGGGGWSYTPPDYGTNLWLGITSVSNGLVSLSLSNTVYTGSGEVYEVMSTPDLTIPVTNWTIATEVWAVSSHNWLAFTAPTASPTNLFIWSRDWTGVTENGNTIPDWWFFKYFGTVALSDTNSDGQGYTFLFDYNHNNDPNIIVFTCSFPNQYVNTSLVTGSIAVLGGFPSGVAVLVDSTNFPAATWTAYASTNVTVNLGSIQGPHSVWIGLRVSPVDPQPVWQETTLVLDSLPPAIAITNPVAGVVTQPMIQLQGFVNEALSGVAFDVSNTAGVFTNKTGYVTSQFYDTNFDIFTTNYFQCYDIGLANGVNTITVHARDMMGNTGSTNIIYTLDYSGDTTPPVLSIIWPQANTAISGSNFTLQAQVDDDTASVQATITGMDGDTNFVTALVERTGAVWANNLPLATGTNTVTVTATDAAGNTSVTNFNVIGNDVGLVINPLPSGQLNQSSVTITGSIGDPIDDAVFVNGIQAFYSDDEGDWEVTNVPVSPTGTASLNVEVYTGDPVLIGSQNQYQLQPATVVMSSYARQLHTSEFVSYYRQPYEDNEVVNWTYNLGGSDVYWGIVPSGEGGQPPNGFSGDDTLAPDGPGFAAFFSPQWEEASPISTTFVNGDGDTESLQSSVQTGLMIVPSGQQPSGGVNVYLVTESAMAYIDPTHQTPGQIPAGPEWLTVNGQTLINSGVTNDDGTESGLAVVSGPSGANVPLTLAAGQAYEPLDFTPSAQAVDITPRLAVDANRDGNVTFDAADQTTTNQPYRFWVNDAQENGDVSGSQYYVPGSSSPNYAYSQVNGHADVVNYFPISLSMSNALQMLPLTNGYEYHLSQADSAVKIIYSSLMPTNAFDYLTNLSSYGYGVNFNEEMTNADTVQVTSGGITLDTNFLNQIQNNGGMGVILAEGCGSTTNPLMLEIWQNGQKLAASPLFLSISGVEQMYRWVNLRGAIGAPQTKATATSEPANNPDSLSNGKNFVFVHGYNVGETSARGWNAEMFKRLYQSGSKAKFYAVTWDGSQSLGDYVSGSTANYQTNVVNAFLTAPYLASLINGLSGSTVLAGHSLGNMVCLSAISDSGAAPSQYFMIDAAVPIEAIDGTAPINNDMVTTNVGGGNWLAYSNRLWASEWYNLWTSTDARSTLTWNNRLMNLGSVDVYNFFSSGEDVLRDDPNVPPSSLLTLLGTELVQYIRGQLGVYVWAWQEKDKGLMSGNTILSSNHGGWLFNDNALNPNNYTTYTVTMPNSIPSSQLQTNAFFDFGWHTFGSDFPDYDYLQVTSSSGTSYATANRNRIISDAIPALTLPIGANYVTNLDVRVSDVRNFDMQALYENNWPVLRQPVNIGASATGEWHHSDIVNVAYPFNFQFFNQIVNVGNIK